MNLQWADLALVGIQRGVDLAFAHATFESGASKNGFEKDVLPSLQPYSRQFEIRGDDPDLDGISNNGRKLSHEYGLVDYLEFLGKSRVPKNGSG